MPLISVSLEIEKTYLPIMRVDVKFDQRISDYFLIDTIFKIVEQAKDGELVPYDSISYVTTQNVKEVYPSLDKEFVAGATCFIRFKEKQDIFLFREKFDPFSLFDDD